MYPGVDRAQLTADEQRATREGALGRALNIPLSDLARNAVGVGEGLMGIATAIPATVFGGVTGYAAGIAAASDGGVPRGQANDVARHVMDAVTENLSTSIETPEGKRFAQTIAKPFMWIDEGVDAIATKMGGGNPIAEASIYTTLNGLMELGLGGFGTALKGKAAAKIKAARNVKELQKTAERLGVRIDQNHLAGDVLTAADRMTPDSRAFNADELAGALEDAFDAKEATAKGIAEVNEARAVTTERLFVDTANARTFARAARQELFEDGFQVDAMPQVMKALNDIERLKERSPAQIAAEGRRTDSTYTGLPDHPDRIDRTIAARNSVKGTRKAETVLENTALENLNSKMDRWLDNQFAKDMIDGSEEALSRWEPVPHWDVRL